MADEKTTENIPPAPEGDNPSWSRVQVARHPKRPHSLDYMNLLLTGFEELHGDRFFAVSPVKCRVAVLQGVFCTFSVVWIRCRSRIRPAVLISTSIVECDDDKQKNKSDRPDEKCDVFDTGRRHILDEL